MLMLVMSVIQFTAAWLYPATSFGGTESLITEKALGVPFQYLLWLMVLTGFFLHTTGQGFDFLMRVLKPWLPLIVVGIVASVFGAQPFVSLRSMMLWILMALSAAMVVGEMPPKKALVALMRGMFAIVLLSVVMALLVPKVGTQLYGTSTKVWRGVFTQKNQLGWVAALTLIIGGTLISRQSWRLPAAMVVLAAACLLGSGSKGALAATMLSIGYLFLIHLLRTRVTPALGVTTVIVLTMSIAVFGIFILPPILSALGHDPTFSGRTTVWSVYFNSMLNTPFIGEGPGAYTSLSELTSPLAMRLGELGAIVTPHNAFLGSFGDGGVLGFLAFFGVLFYLAVVAPFLRQDRITLTCAGVAAFNMVHGMVETHEVFAAGVGWYCMIFLRAVTLRELARVPVARIQTTPLARSSSGPGTQSLKRFP
jgi:O-antigen ligase